MKPFRGLRPGRLLPSSMNEKTGGGKRAFPLDNFGRNINLYLGTMGWFINVWLAF